MKISLVSIAFNGYGRFIGQFLAFASSMNPLPDEVVIVLGKDHGCKDLTAMKSIYPGVKIVKYEGDKISFGKLRNVGISKTSSEWTWFVSIDDKPMPDAIQTFERALAQEDADYICAKWYTIGLGKPLVEHRSPTPMESAERLKKGKGMGFIIPHSPFKRFLWEKHRYAQTDLPNYDFLLGCVKNNARFIKSDIPTTTYLRRSDSHARTTLRTKKVKTEANRQKGLMKKGIREHYS